MNKKVLFSIFILFMFCVVSSPCIYAKTQNVSNETELKNALNDATIDEIKLTSNSMPYFIFFCNTFFSNFIHFIITKG